MRRGRTRSMAAFRSLVSLLRGLDQAQACVSQRPVERSLPARCSVSGVRSTAGPPVRHLGDPSLTPAGPRLPSRSHREALLAVRTCAKVQFHRALRSEDLRNPQIGRALYRPPRVRHYSWMPTKTVMLKMVEAFGTGDVARVDQFVSPDYVDHQGLGEGEVRGASGFANVVQVVMIVSLPQSTGRNSRPALRAAGRRHIVSQFAPDAG
jgi:hypothetical protein